MYQNMLLALMMISLNACCSANGENVNKDNLVCCDYFYHCVQCDDLFKDEKLDDNGLSDDN